MANKNNKDKKERKGGKKMNFNLKSYMKDSVALFCAGAVGAGAGFGTAKAIDAGVDAYKKYNATELVKKHWWSRPIEVYCRNGQPVNK